MSVEQPGKDSTMLKVEIVDGGTIRMIERLEANGFRHIESHDYIGRTSQDFGLPVEVWMKSDGKREVTLMDFGDLPEVEDE